MAKAQIPQNDSELQEALTGRVMFHIGLLEAAADVVVSPDGADLKIVARIIRDAGFEVYNLTKEQSEIAEIKAKDAAGEAEWLMYTGCSDAQVTYGNHANDSPSQLDKDVKLLRKFVDNYLRQSNLIIYRSTVVHRFEIDALDRILSGFEFADKHKDDA